ncbi:MAG: stage V sporulation protein AC, partial [Clostridia bacterium]|nr:stage V sporulation protein AC [Clostridia bacterium]
MKKDFTAEEYKKYVAQISPKSKTFRDCIIAFLVGGAICTIAQLISWGMRKYGIDEAVVKKSL